jgi:hypothetical protein
MTSGTEPSTTEDHVGRLGVIDLGAWLRDDPRLMRLFPVVTLLGAFALSSCAGPERDTAYVAEIDAWHADRVASLRRDTSQLTQVGLHRLPAGTSTLGSADDADIVLHERAPARLGEVSVVGRAVTFTAAEGVEVHRFGSEPLQRVERVELTAPAPDGGTMTLATGRMLYHVITREDVLVLRVRDRDSADRIAFESPDRFPVSTGYRVTARLVPGTAAWQTMRQEGGFVYSSPTPGVLEFELDGQTCRLRPNLQADGRLFFVFADATTGRETYPGGRFLYADPLDADGRAVLDFNRTYTPVCAWNAFSTCPRPLPENTLPIAVRAGEKYTPHDS